MVVGGFIRLIFCLCYGNCQWRLSCFASFRDKFFSAPSIAYQRLVLAKEDFPEYPPVVHIISVVLLGISVAYGDNKLI